MIFTLTDVGVRSEVWYSNYISRYSSNEITLLRDSGTVRQPRATLERSN